MNFTNIQIDNGDSFDPTSGLGFFHPTNGSFQPYLAGRVSVTIILIKRCIPGQNEILKPLLLNLNYIYKLLVLKKTVMRLLYYYININ